ncbi:MAG: hypothetical protein N3A58_05220 [Spirochaetes bacterium]|nr:hypothetical protein [Spirochaetota bacterium]
MKKLKLFLTIFVLLFALLTIFSSISTLAQSRTSAQKVEIGKLLKFKMEKGGEFLFFFDAVKGKTYEIWLYDSYNSDFTLKALWFQVRKGETKDTAYPKEIYTEPNTSKTLGDGGYTPQDKNKPAAVVKAEGDKVYIFVWGAKEEYTGEFGLNIKERK